MTGKVLLVDDDPAVREVVGELLDRAGYGVTAVADGDGVLDRLQNGDTPPDLILLDLMMPHHNGWALINTLREHPEWREIAIVIFSGAADAAELAMRANLFFLAKACPAETLLSIVECYAGSHATRRPRPR